MQMHRVEIAGLGLEAASGMPLVLLRETDEPHRLLPIFVGGAEAAAIGVALTGEAPPRPLAYDLMADLVVRLGGQVERVEVTELRDGTFLAALAVTGPGGDLRLDTRPSDAIALAVRTHSPLYVSATVLDEVGTRAPDEVGTRAPDDAAIDEQVAEFRSQLDGLDPADFTDPAEGDPAEFTDEGD
jgi:hypothetical protein